MQTLSEIRTYVSNVIEDDSAETLGIIDVWINKALKSLCDRFSWSGYTKTKTITPGVSTGAFYAPPGFAGVIQIVPADDSFGSFQFFSASSRRRNRLYAPYYMEMATRVSDGAVDTAGTFANGSSAVTATGSIFAPSDVGESLLLGSEGYEYEIASYVSATSVTITPVYRGESATATGRITIRPAGVRQFAVYDQNDKAYTSDVILIYKTVPQKLYNDYDRPLINADEALKFGALIEALRNEKYSIDAERIKQDYVQAVENARQSEIGVPRIGLPKGLLTPMPAFSFHTNRNNSPNEE